MGVPVGADVIDRNSRRIGGERPAPRPAPTLPPAVVEAAPRGWPIEAIKKVWALEAESVRLKRRVYELETSIMENDRARRVTENALALYGDSESVKSLTARLTFMLPNAEEIGQRGVALVAQIAIAHGLDPLPGSDHVYCWRQGSKLTTVIGYKGLLHLARKQFHFTHQTRPMTSEERTEHGVGEKEIGYITELWEIAKAKECQEVGIPYHPIVGIGKWKPGDNVAAGRPNTWHPRKNSLKDALRQVVTTGERMADVWDSAFRELGAKLGGQVEYTGEGWAVEVSDDEAQAAIDSGLVPPSDDGDDAAPPVLVEGTARPAEAAPDPTLPTPAEPVAPPAPRPGALPKATKAPDHGQDVTHAACARCHTHAANPDNPIDPTLCDACARLEADAHA